MCFDVLDINECDDSSTCNGVGACTDTPGSYTCDCTDTGYEGTDCETGKLILTHL